MPQVPRSSMKGGARRLLVTALAALVAGACDPSTASSQAGSTSAVQESPRSQFPRAQDASQSIDESRMTAIVRATARAMAAGPGVRDDAIIVSAAKGLEEKTLKRMSEVLDEELGALDRIATLSGPSHAEEVSRHMPTSVVAASTSRETAQRVQEVFFRPYFRIYTNSDIVGVEIGTDADLGLELLDLLVQRRLRDRVVGCAGRFGVAAAGRDEVEAGEPVEVDHGLARDRYGSDVCGRRLRPCAVSK